MSYLKHCSTALAALTISTMPAHAQENEDQDGRPRLVFIQVEDQDSTTTNMLIEVRRRAAVRICGEDFSRSSRVACTLSEEDAREAGLLGGDAGDDNQDGDEDDEYVDANRGHGNDPDGFDEDNPGQGHGNDRGGNGQGNGNGGNRGGGND